MDMHRLNNSDMRKLVRIFKDVPFPTSRIKEEFYQTCTRKNIARLPCHLRSSPTASSSTPLCPIHNGLDDSLITDVWTSICYEIDTAIGRFLYPLLMSDLLSLSQELKARCLEPVRQMWHPDFRTETSAPPGRSVILSLARQWNFQRNQCPACMLARIGSDADVLVALFAGMLGRMRHKVSKGILGFEKIRGSRLRFVRYWLRAAKEGRRLVAEASELGMEMQRLRRRWKMEQRRVWNAGHLDRIRGKDEQGLSGVSHDAPEDVHGENMISSPKSVEKILFHDHSTQTRSKRSPLNNTNLAIRPEHSISDLRYLHAPPPLNLRKLLNASPPSQAPVLNRRDSVIGDLPTFDQYTATSNSIQPKKPLHSVGSASTILSYSGDGNGEDGDIISQKQNFSRSSSYYPESSPPSQTKTKHDLATHYRALLPHHPHTHNSRQKYHISNFPPPRPESMYSSFSFSRKANNDDSLEVVDEEDVEQDSEGEGEQQECGLGLREAIEAAKANCWESILKLYIDE